MEESSLWDTSAFFISAFYITGLNTFNQSTDTEIYLIKSLWIYSHGQIQIFTRTSLLYLAFQFLHRDQQWPVHLFLKGLWLYCSRWASKSFIILILPFELRIIALWSGIQEAGMAPEQSTGPLGLRSCCLTLLAWTLSQYHVAQHACLFAMSRWRAVGLGTLWANGIMDGIMSPRFSKRQLFFGIQVRSSTYCAWKGDN